MKVALEVWSSSYQEVEATCMLAEKLGFDAFYYGEAPHGLNLDCWTTLAALARSTEAIRLGPVIANILPTYRSNALLAKQATNVATISGGRLDFRTGAGAAAAFGRAWWEPFGVTYPAYAQRLSDLEEALHELPRHWQQEHAIPITVAATGSRAMRVAAAHADVWETSFCTSTEFVSRRAAVTACGSGRSITRSLEIDGFVSRTGQGMDRLIARVRLERGTNEDLDPVFERALVGVPSDAVERLRGLAVAGVDQVVVALHDPHDPDALEALAETAAAIATSPNKAEA